MKRFKTRLQLEIAIVSLLMIVAIGFLLGKLFISYQNKTVFSNLKEEAGFIELYVEQRGGLSNFNENDEKKLQKYIDSSFMLLKPNGDPIYKSKQPSDWPEKQKEKLILSLTEKALTYTENGSKGTVKDSDIKYYFKPIVMDNEREGFVLLSLHAEDTANVSVWVVLFVSLGLAYAILVVFGYQVINRHTLPIESAKKAAMELARGNYRARTYISNQDDTGLLNQSINTIARNLQEMKIAHEVQKDRLSTLIENMGSALLLIDDKGYISMINHAYKELFKVEEEDSYMSELYYRTIEHEEINSLIEEIFMIEQKVKKQIVLAIGIERKHFEIYGAPIMGPKGEWKGILLVFHDITELKKLESVRKQFVANVSHELNTPVTSIKGFTETLLDGAMNDEQTLKNFLEIILKESDRLQSLIKELLELSKVEQQGFRLDLQEIDIVPLLKDTYDILEKKAIQKEITFVLEELNAPIIMKADPFRLKQVFINLVNNAISYTPAEGKVEISAWEEEDKIFVSIKDTGIGIQEEEIPRIFERFYRVDKDRSRESGGTGLGLAIGKHLIEAHNGEITVTSKLNEGATFTVILPKNQ